MTETEPRARRGQVGRDGEVSGNKATARTLQVLSAFANGADSLGVTELSHTLGMTKSMVHRALTTLLEYGYVVRDVTGARYQLGLEVLRLYPRDATAPEIGDLAGEAMQAMYQISGETVTLNVRAGRNVLTVDGRVGDGPIARSVPLGRTTPLHANVAGRAILSHLSDAEIARYLAEPLETFTHTTLATPDEVRHEVRLVRSRGYALGYQDHVPNTAGVAFPILDRHGAPWGSISVGGYLQRLTPERLGEYIPELEKVAAALNRRSRLYDVPASWHG